MRRRDLSKALLASAAGATVVSQSAQAQTCNQPCYPQTAAESSAGVTPTNTTYLPLNPFRYGADGTGGANDTNAYARITSVLAAMSSTNGWLNGLATPGFTKTVGEVAAGYIPTNFYRFSEPYDIRRYGAHANGSTNPPDTAALTSALAVGTVTANGAQGAAITVPTGVSVLDATVTLPDRVRVLGQNKRGSIFRAISTWNAGAWMFHAVNGTQPVFDSTLENLTVDAQNISGLGCVLSDAWQEGAGLRGALIEQFGTVGIQYQNGYGAALSKIVDSEIFGGTVAGAIGINLLPIGAVGAFMLDVSNTTIAGGNPPNLAYGIKCTGCSLHLRNVHFESCNSAIYLDGPGNHLFLGVSGSSTSVGTLIEIASTFTGMLTAVGCFRNGTATNFLVDHRPGGLGTISGYDLPILSINASDQTASVRASSTASAWCVFDGTKIGTNSPNNGFNVGSVQRTATGSYTVTFAHPLANANAAVAASSNLAYAASSVRTVLANTISVQVYIYVNGALTDSNEVKVIVFGG